MDRPSLHPSALDDHDDSAVEARTEWGFRRRFLAAGLAMIMLLRSRLFVLRRQTDLPRPLSPWWLVMLRMAVVACGGYVAALAILAYGVLRISPTTEQPPAISDDIGARAISPGVWFYGQLTARRVLNAATDPLRKPSPLAIVVPDAHAAEYETRDLLIAIHRAGYLIALVDPMAGGEGFSRMGVGEAATVRYVKDQLLKRPDVDAGRVVLIGRGTGAVACLLASQNSESSSGRSLVLIDLPASPEEWMQAQMPRFCRYMPGLIGAKWLSEISLSFDADEAEGKTLLRCVPPDRFLLLDSVECGSSDRMALRVEAFLHRRSLPVADSR